MADIKPGDRVRVDFEGVVTDVLGGVTYVTTDNGGEFELTSDLCTVVARPVKVGDVVTEANVGQLSIGSVVGHPGRLVTERIGSSARRWHCTNGVAFADSHVIGAVVLRIGGGS